MWYSHALWKGALLTPSQKCWLNIFSDVKTSESWLNYKQNRTWASPSAVNHCLHIPWGFIFFMALSCDNLWWCVLRAQKYIRKSTSNEENYHRDVLMCALNNSLKYKCLVSPHPHSVLGCVVTIPVWTVATSLTSGCLHFCEIIVFWTTQGVNAGTSTVSQATFRNNAYYCEIHCLPRLIERLHCIPPRRQRHKAGRGWASAWGSHCR